MTGVLITEGNFEDRDTQRERHMTTETKGGVMQLQVKECEGLRVTTGNWKRQGSVFPKSLYWERGSADTLILDFQPQNCKKINFCCFKPSSWRYFAPAVPKLIQ